MKMTHENTPVTADERGFGFCLEDAIKNSGRAVEGISEWMLYEDAKRVLENIGYIFHDESRLGVGPTEVPGNVPMIIIYKSRPNRYHAEYTEDFGKVHTRITDMIAYITFPER